MGEPHPEDSAIALPVGQQQLDQESEAEIRDRNRRAAALIRQWRAEASEEDEEMWPLVKKEFNLL